MIIHPELRALRGDDTPQRNAQEALIRAVAAWRGRPHVAALLEDLEAFDAQGVEADCPVLCSLFAGGMEDARELTDELVRAMTAHLAEQPLGHVPFRHFTDGVVSTLLLARAGNTTLSLVALDGDGLAGRPAPVTADFSPSEVWERVLAGTGRAERVERMFTGEKEALLDRRDVDLSPGMVIARDAAREALLVREVHGRLVTLRLQRRKTGAGPTREYQLETGRLVHQAAGNPQDSRVELMMALLGRMRRTDAAPVLARIACGDGSAALRWQALRECLALDTATGFAALAKVAMCESDELAATANALRLQLVQSYPQLVEIDPCHA